jgi:SAM-dependent methyltransferase
MISRIKNLVRTKLHNEAQRNDFVRERLSLLPATSLLLDAGCGSQQYRKYCDHLIYKAQDFAQYNNDTGDGFTSGMGGETGYVYGEIDYVGDIWAVDEVSSHFDAILCTEVFEHIPYPNETVKEFARLLKPGGQLILTVPSNCLRHMDPYFFYSGFSDRYLRKILDENGIEIELIEPVGDYYSWISVELARTMRHHSPLSWIFNGPALLWFMMKRPTAASVNTLCMGYHVVARRRPL